MATTLSSATMTVRVIESIKLNGTEQGAVNTRTISSINEISKRILTVPTSETVVTSFSTAVATGTFIEGEKVVGIGTTLRGSDAVYIVRSTTTPDDLFGDNDPFESEADQILDFTERNPFGEF